VAPLGDGRGYKFPFIFILHSAFSSHSAFNKKTPNRPKGQFEVQKGTVPLKVSLKSAITGGTDAPFPAHCREGGIICGCFERAFSPRHVSLCRQNPWRLVPYDCIL